MMKTPYQHICPKSAKMHRLIPCFSSLFTRFNIIGLLFIILMISKYNIGWASELQTIEQNLTDTMITTKIKTKIAKNKNLNPLKISVSTHDGIVTLRGYAKNKQAFVDTLRIATSTNGVKGVNTADLEIKHVNSSFADAYITAKVEAAVLEAKVFDSEDIPLVGINAKTKNGVVYLSGKLPSSKAIDAILKRVNRVRGVKRVVSHLEIM